MEDTTIILVKWYLGSDLRRLILCCLYWGDKFQWFCSSRDVCSQNIVSILLLYDVDLWLKQSEKPSENLLDTRDQTSDRPSSLPMPARGQRRPLSIFLLMWCVYWYIHVDKHVAMRCSGHPQIYGQVGILFRHYRCSAAHHNCIIDPENHTWGALSYQHAEDEKDDKHSQWCRFVLYELDLQIILFNLRCCD